MGVDEVGEAFYIGQEETGGLAGGDGVAEGGEGEYLLGGDDGGVASPAFLQQGCRLHHLDHVEVVARGAAIGSQRHTCAGLEEFEHRKAVAAAELEVRVGTVDAGDMVVADKFYLILREMQAVGSNDVLPQFIQNTQFI